MPLVDEGGYGAGAGTAGGGDVLDDGSGGISYTPYVSPDGPYGSVYPAGTLYSVGSNGSVSTNYTPPKGSTGQGSTNYTTIMSGQLGANRYTTYTDSSGNLWQVDNLDGSQSIIQKAPSNANPADKNNDGLDDTTNMALGVYPSKLSWTGFAYGNGIEVWPNGAPAGPNPNPAAAPAPKQAPTWTGYGPKGQGTYYLDGPNGTPGTFIGTTVAPPKPTTTSVSGGFSGGGGGGGSFTPPRDYAGEQKTQNAYLAAQAELNREFQREMDMAKNETDIAIAEMNYAINLRKLGLDEKQFGVNAAETFGRLASSTDPLAFAAFLHAGGGNIMNALGTGADALSSAALLPGARALQAMRGLGSNPTSGGGFGSTPTTGGGGATPTPTDPGAAPPATPPVVAPPSDVVNQGGRMVNTNTDPTHGVYVPQASRGEGGGALGGQAGINPYAGMQYEVIAGPTLPASVPPPPPPPPPPDVPGGMAGGVQFDSPLPDQPPGTVYDSGTNDADRLYNDLYNRPPLPNRAVIPAFANGTMRGLTRAPMMMTGDATGRNPAANGARPEIITNPTGAPLGVIPFPQARQMMRGLNMPRYAEGTTGGNWWDTAPRTYDAPGPGQIYRGFDDGSYAVKPAQTSQPVAPTQPIATAPTQPPAPTTPAPSTAPTAPTSSLSDPALQTPTAMTALQPSSSMSPQQWAQVQQYQSHYTPDQWALIQQYAPVASPGAVPGVVPGTATGVTPVATAPVAPPPPIGANVPGSGYGVSPLTDAQLGVTPGDRAAMEEVLRLRQATQIPELSYYDIAFNDWTPTMQQMKFSGLQGAFGIPQQDSIADWQKYRMRGLSGSNLSLGV